MHGTLWVKKKNFMSHGIYCFYHYKTLFWGFSRHWLEKIGQMRFSPLKWSVLSSFALTKT